VTGKREVPLPGEPLDFVLNTRTGCVHVVPRDAGAPADVPPGEWGQAVAATLAGPPPQMMCGTRLRYGWPGAAGEWVNGGNFTDEDLCVPCVHALGDQSWRAFHSDNRGGT
jgi:hypothetical protein